jgi:hypothetical protein
MSSSQAAGDDGDLEPVTLIRMQAEDTFDGQERVMTKAAYDLQCRATSYSMLRILQAAGRALGDAVPCRAAGRSATTAATGAEFPRRGEWGTPDQGRRPVARVAGPSAIPANGRRDQAISEADAVRDAAVAAYRLSAQAGNPLSERKLAQMFGRTSRRWARARIAEARRIPSSGP